MWAKRVLITGGILAAAAATRAAEFPLQWKALSAEEAMASEDAKSIMAILRKTRPKAVAKEPKATSKSPLYGLLEVDGDDAMVCRFDESKEGRGYDRLIIDFNRNGDLNDDPVAKALAKPARGPEISEPVLFGPIDLAMSKESPGWKPRYYVQAFVEGAGMGFLGIHGFMELHPGGYLETTVDLEGVKQRLAFVDSNCNARLGEKAALKCQKMGPMEMWMLAPCDGVLRDRDGSGEFDSEDFSDESELLSSLIYFGPVPYEIALAPGYKSVRIHPVEGELGELVAPAHKDICEIRLGRQVAKDKWEVIQPGLADGKFRVPAGTYRLYGCVLSGKAKDGSEVTATGLIESKADVIDVAAGGNATLACGTPVDLRLKATSRVGGILGALFGLGSLKYDFELQIVGAGGEVYNSFYQDSEENYFEPPPPQLRVSDENGVEVATGKFEFG